ncbi:MAG: ATP-binding protein [Candidatus Woesearchaeota archaeon]|nr:ATP-binding protein [Candidatus Woesearchaeota archaeon]
MKEEVDEDSIRKELIEFGIQAQISLQQVFWEWKSKLTKTIQEITAPVPRLLTNARSTNNNSIRLAGALLNHDINSYAQLVNIAVAFAKENDKKTHRLYARIQTFRALCSTVSYLASEGKSDYTIPFLPADLEEMLDAKSHHIMILPEAPQLIYSPEFVGALQIVNNSKHKNKLQIALGKEAVGKGKEHFYFQIDDTGTGLLNQEGKPALKEDTRRIFKGYSTKTPDHKQHGLGLQIAAELARLRAGYITVRSTTSDGITKTYRTDTEETSETEEKHFQGCTFRFFFKKDL